jgi:hypothetical protein
MNIDPEAHLASLRQRRDHPAVKAVNGYFEFYVDGEMVYDFKPADAGLALRWIEHMAHKSWVTKEHLSLFAMLAAEQFGARHI